MRQISAINIRIALVFFVASVYLMYTGNIKWGFSLVILSFFMNLAAIYATLVDDENKFQIRNLVMKMSLFIFQVFAFNWALAIIQLI